MGSLAAGQILAGRYRLVAPLGRGAMGEVWKAEHVALGAPVAIKVIVDGGFDEGNPLREELLTRFFREAQAAAALRSPHVVQILDHGVENGIPYIAMELLEGETLEQRLERFAVLPNIQVAEFVTHVARAISKAHEVGIVHRDLKPGNVFIVRNDDEEIAKVLDFGIAKITPNATFEEGGGVATRTGSVVGTPCYMSPEQALGNKTIDYRSDLWSLAVIAFECVVGKRPFDSEAFGDLIVQICARPMPVPSKVGAVPEGFDAWFAKAACREPEGRFQSAKELAEALRYVLAPETVSVRARLTQTSQPLIRPSRPSAVPEAPSSQPNSSPDAFARTAAQQLTHMGVVSAISAPHKKRRRPLILVSALSFVLVTAVGLFIILGRGSSESGESGDPALGSSAGVAPALAPSAGATAAPSPATAPTSSPDTAPGSGAATGDGVPAGASAQPSAPSVSPAVSGTQAPAGGAKPGVKPVTSGKVAPTSGTQKPWTPPGGKKPPDRLGI
jgi:serine/threonine protein kinase